MVQPAQGGGCSAPDRSDLESPHPEPPAAQGILTFADARRANSADQLWDQPAFSVSSIVLLQPGARYWFKAWPPERFAELADRLTFQYGCQVLIGGSRQEGDLAQQIQQMAKSRPISMAGRTTIKQFAAIAKKSALFVGNDSGAMHIASAVGTPVVALFGPSSPVEWGPRGGTTEVIYKGLDCACFHNMPGGEQNCISDCGSRGVAAAPAASLAGSRNVRRPHAASDPCYQARRARLAEG